MQYSVVVLSLFAAFSAAQSSNSTSLPDLVSQLPQCATGCLASASSDAKCNTADFECLCGDGRSTFTSSIFGCLLTSTCSQDDRDSLISLAPQICNAVSSNPDPSAVASASNLITSAVGTATPTSTPDAAARPEIGFGLLGGAAALAAFAL
ncbi:uncharacterized protein GGS25DRAFT_511669 [Hypoxylon fragiforme]|uniref:uncharacterized protein n=1 Tax=Hypoxylon fragiforme TaxID=63214 RepID=UPI0020C6D0F7|nr:uncharacterized protein GGS25DRAFT_511669 [Hypoxylon fragiforme]KAI2603508.1 hypothetical protein GGS25DRAFT_511669 [Hypoxylon fragiforme]